MDDKNIAMTAITVTEYEEYQRLKHTHYINNNSDLVKKLEAENKRLKEWFDIFKTLNECNIKLIDGNILNCKGE